MGSAAHSRRTAQARHQYRRNERKQVLCASGSRRPRPGGHSWRITSRAWYPSISSLVPTIRFQVLYVFLVLAHERRRILHFAVTAHPTAEWTAQHLREAFPWDSAPRYLLRDRDRIFGHDFVEQVKAMGIKQVLSAPRSPWQRAYIERVIGTIRLECLDHVIVFSECSLYHHYVNFLTITTGLALTWDCRRTARNRVRLQPPEAGRIISIPEVEGFHHRYEGRVA